LGSARESRPARAFDRFTDILEYEANVEGIEVVELSERETLESLRHRRRVGEL
jgi:hypothetical protein